MLKKLLNHYKPLIWQLFKFGTVGISAAIVNFFGVVFFVQFFSWNPLIANIVAFFIAYNVSFCGHHYWTFCRAATNKTPWIRFLVVAIGSFGLNESLFAMFIHWVHLFYPVALILTLIIVPPITFIFSKFWAFK